MDSKEIHDFIKSDIIHLRSEIKGLREILRSEIGYLRKDIKGLSEFKWKLTGILMVVTALSATGATWAFRWMLA